MFTYMAEDIAWVQRKIDSADRISKLSHFPKRPFVVSKSHEELWITICCNVPHRFRSCPSCPSLLCVVCSSCPIFLYCSSCLLLTYLPTIFRLSVVVRARWGTVVFHTKIRQRHPSQVFWATCNFVFCTHFAFQQTTDTSSISISTEAVLDVSLYLGGAYCRYMFSECVFS